MEILLYYYTKLTKNVSVKLYFIYVNMCIFICKFILTISILQENDTFFYFMFNMRTRLFIRDFITIWWIFFMGYNQRKRRAWVLFRDPECVFTLTKARIIAERRSIEIMEGKSLCPAGTLSQTRYFLSSIHLDLH